MISKYNLCATRQENGLELDFVRPLAPLFLYFIRFVQRLSCSWPPFLQFVVYLTICHLLFSVYHHYVGRLVALFLNLFHFFLSFISFLSYMHLGSFMQT